MPPAGGGEIVDIAESSCWVCEICRGKVKPVLPFFSLWKARKESQQNSHFSLLLTYQSMEERALKYADNSVDGVLKLAVLRLIQFQPVFFEEFRRSLCIWNDQIKKTTWFMDCSAGSQACWHILFDSLAFPLLYHPHFSQKGSNVWGARQTLSV